MRQEAWPIASDAWEWSCTAGVLVVREALVVVRARGVCAGARCRVASCCTRSLIAFSDLGGGLSGLDRVGTAR